MTKLLHVTHNMPTDFDNLSFPTSNLRKSRSKWVQSRNNAEVLNTQDRTSASQKGGYR